MTQQKAGPELDKAVAEAIGLRPLDIDYNPSARDFPCVEYFRGADSGIVRGQVWYWRDGQFVSFKPSTDLNAAFAAADRAGVFNEWSLAQWDSGWGFEGTYESALGVSQATPALAICAAILELKSEATRPSDTSAPS